MSPRPKQNDFTQDDAEHFKQEITFYQKRIRLNEETIKYYETLIKKVLQEIVHSEGSIKHYKRKLKEFDHA